MSLGYALRQLAFDDTGQDLIEYALLTAIVTVAAIPVIVEIRDRMQSAYIGWGNDIQNNWSPNDPVGAGS
jgi:Flp pilus assembly pilin Flp